MNLLERDRGLKGRRQLVPEPPKGTLRANRRLALAETVPVLRVMGTSVVPR